ncbi:MAG TPA: MBL fold metallo-hydrolase [Candidatus Paceibacterota bacterium]
MRKSTRILGVVILALLVMTFCIWSAVWQVSTGGKLTVTFLNIGQGDAVFIQSPSGGQALIDGGPDSSVLRELSKVMPWWDRSLDVVIGTHPDADHIGGLIDVLQRYDVSYILQSSVQGSTPIWHSFEDAISTDEKKGTKIITAKRGQIIDLGDGAYLEVLSPDRDVPHVDTNVGCVVTRLVYGNTSFMLSCDAPQAIENYLVSLDGANLHSNVLKAGHHGSKTSSSLLFVGFVNPEYAVYSRGCNNKYGHPNQETIATFAKFGIPTLDTCKDGAITFVSDGKIVSHVQ